MTILLRCRRCDGTGLVGSGASARVCPACGGTGVVEVRPLPQTAPGYAGRNDDDGDGDGI